MTKPVEETRETYGKRIGEIIEDVLGRDELRKKLDAAGGGPSDKPAGIQALQLGIVTPEVKDALLIAQASIRTIETVERIEAFHKNEKTAFEKDIENYEPGDHVPVKSDDPVFKYVGSDGDSVELTRAQAVNQLAVVYEHNEKFALKDAHGPMGKVPDFVSYDLEYADGFRNSATAGLHTASDILKQNGLDDAANDLTAVADASGPKNASKFTETPTPGQFAQSHLWQQQRLVQDVNIILDPMGDRDPPYASLSSGYAEMLETRGKQASAGLGEKDSVLKIKAASPGKASP